MIEAEIKARVNDPKRLRGLLRKRGAEVASRYRDTYYDRDGELARGQRELRLRVAESTGGRRSVITHKGPVADQETGSKPETETEVADAAAADEILRGLGFAPLVAFEKHCLNYSFTWRGRKVLATMVSVPELDGAFVEVETAAAGLPDMRAALDDIRALLYELGVGRGDFTTELYTDAVMRRRREGR